MMLCQLWGTMARANVKQVKVMCYQCSGGGTIDVESTLSWEPTLAIKCGNDRNWEEVIDDRTWNFKYGLHMQER